MRRIRLISGPKPSQKGGTNQSCGWDTQPSPKEGRTDPSSKITDRVSLQGGSSTQSLESARVPGERPRARGKFMRDSTGKRFNSLRERDSILDKN